MKNKKIWALLGGLLILLLVVGLNATNTSLFQGALKASHSDVHLEVKTSEVQPSDDPIEKLFESYFHLYDIDLTAHGADIYIKNLPLRMKGSSALFDGIRGCILERGDRELGEILMGCQQYENRMFDFEGSVRDGALYINQGETRSLSFVVSLSELEDEGWPYYGKVYLAGANRIPAFEAETGESVRVNIPRGSRIGDNMNLDALHVSAPVEQPENPQEEDGLFSILNLKFSERSRSLMDIRNLQVQVITEPLEASTDLEGCLYEGDEARTECVLLENGTLEFTEEDFLNSRIGRNTNHILTLKVRPNYAGNFEIKPQIAEISSINATFWGEDQTNVNMRSNLFPISVSAVNISR